MRPQVKTRSKREKLQRAFDYLMTKEAQSAYRDLVKQHRKFLRSHPAAPDADRRRPLQFIETPGVECALWPTLYWCTEMCETVERATDARRLKRLGQAAVLNDDRTQASGTASNAASCGRS